MVHCYYGVQSNPITAFIMRERSFSDGTPSDVKDLGDCRSPLSLLVGCWVDPEALLEANKYVNQKR